LRPALEPRDRSFEEQAMTEPRQDRGQEGSVEARSPQLLHLVFGGELKNPETYEFRNPAKIDVVGIFPDYASAERAWRAKAQMTVDSAETRYFIVHLHRFLDPAGLTRQRP
jgi:hypothetical protein